MRQDRPKAIKSALTIRDVFGMFGYTVPSKDGETFSSPLRDDRNPSCTIKNEKFHDWARGLHLDVIDLYAEIVGASSAEAISALYARVSRDSVGLRVLTQSSIRADFNQPDRSAQRAEAEEKSVRREKWKGKLIDLQPHFRDCLSTERGFSLDAIDLASRQGNLYGFSTFEGYAWVVANTELTNGQARLFGGKRWKDANDAKAKTLPGSFASHPIIGQLMDHHAIALVEGGPDFVAALHHAIESGVEDSVCPVAMLGAGMVIPDQYLAKFAGHRVRIFAHADEAGQKAAERWAAQLQSVNCFCDGFDFTGLVQADGRPVKDLNDLCRIGADCLEANRGLIESVFSFALEAR
jgi:DNA primase